MHVLAGERARMCVTVCHVRVCVRTRVRVRAHACACVRACWRSVVHACAYACMHGCVHACACVYVRACVCVCECVRRIYEQSKIGPTAFFIVSLTDFMGHQAFTIRREHQKSHTEDQLM